MKSKMQVQVTFMLILAVFAYGITSSVDVFYSAFFLPEEASSHSHSGEHGYCGFVYQSPGYLCVHSLPVLDTYKAPVIHSGGSVKTVRSPNTDPVLASAFDFYRFRAPPIPLTTWPV